MADLEFEILYVFLLTPILPFTVFSNFIDGYQVYVNSIRINTTEGSAHFASSISVIYLTDTVETNVYATLNI